MTIEGSEDDIYEHKYAEWGLDALQDVSRTFALSLEYLPSPLQSYVSTAYLLCRIPDTIEDSNRLHPDEKSNLLHIFESVVSDSQPPTEFTKAVMHSIGEDKPHIATYNADWNLVMETEKVIELFESFDSDIKEGMRPWVVELTQGMREFVERYADEGGVRVKTYDELEEYCYYVAGTVGHLLAETIGEYYDVEVTDELHQAAEEYGLILQFVNIAKDVHDDFETENNIYLPIEELEDYGVSPEEITDQSNASDVGDVVVDVITEAEAFFPKAKQFLQWFRETVEREADFASFALPYLLAIATIRDLHTNSDLAVDETEVKISREEVLEITKSVTSGDADTLSEYETDIHQGKYKSDM